MRRGDVFSVLIQLRAVSSRPIPPRIGEIGYLGHAAFLDLLRQVDPVLSQQLHDLNQRKPFTLSSLSQVQSDRFRSEPLYQLRLTTLSAEIFGAFMSRFLGLDTANLKLFFMGVTKYLI